MPLRQKVEQCRNLGRIDLEGEAEIRLVGRSLADLRQHRQVDRRQQIIGSAIDQRLVAEYHALGALDDDRKARLVGRAIDGCVAGMAMNAQTWDCGLVVAVLPGDPGNDVDHVLSGSLSRGCHILWSFQRLSIVCGNAQIRLRSAIAIIYFSFLQDRAKTLQDRDNAFADRERIVPACDLPVTLRSFRISQN